MSLLDDDDNSTGENVFTPAERMLIRLGRNVAVMATSIENLAKAVEKMDHELLGNGRPGRIELIEARLAALEKESQPKLLQDLKADVDTLKEYKWRIVGFIGGSTALIEIAKPFVLKLLHP